MFPSLQLANQGDKPDDLVNCLHPFQNISNIGNFILAVVTIGIFASVGLCFLRSWLRGGK